MKKIISISLIAMAGLAVSSAALSGGGIPGGFPAHDTAVGKMPAHVYGSLPTFPPSRAVSQPSGVQTQSIPQSFPAHNTAMDKMPSQAKERQPTFPPSRAVSQPSGVQTQSIPSMPDRSLQGTSRIPSGPGRDGFNNRGRR
jgi:hypothetical protein